MRLREIPRHGWAFALLAVMVSVYITHGLIARPSYTDAYYYFNAAERLVRGDGLTDAYLWQYIGLPEGLPAPSHTYWMPLTSLAAAGGMALLGAPGAYDAAQVPFALMLAALACLGFWLGGRLARLDGASDAPVLRYQWVAGLLTLFSGFFTRFWGATDTFGPYAISGALALVLPGLALAAAARGASRRWWMLAGAAAGFGHLARADGLLLLIVGVVAALWPRRWLRGDSQKSAAFDGAAIPLLLVGYLLVMGPWFARNLSETGAILPVGGLDAAWFPSYDALFNYPPGAAPADLFADGLGTFLESRWVALSNNAMTFIAVEGLVVMTPLMLLALMRRWRDPLLLPFAVYALGLHLAMTFVFPFPGYRGGLFHSVAALIPFWAALGVLGLDDTVAWVAARRRTWRPRQASRVFSVGLVMLAVALSWNIGQSGRVSDGTPILYEQLDSLLPADAVVMVNDPAALYYFTERGGVVIPNADVQTVPQIAARYGVTHLLLETVSGQYAVPAPFDFDPERLPPFLRRVDVDLSGAELYVLVR